MGSNSSKSARKGHTLADPSSASNPPPSASASGASDARLAAADAAERRLKTAQARGTTSSNPNRGALAAKVEASKSMKGTSDQRQDDRLVWD